MALRFVVFSLASLFSILWLIPLKSALGAPTVVHHDLTIKIHPDTRSMSGADVMTVRTDEAASLQLMLNPSAKILSVTWNDQSTTQSMSSTRWAGDMPLDAKRSQKAESSRSKEAPFRFDRGRLEVSVPKEYKSAETTLRISYEAVFTDPIPRDPLNTEDPTYGVTGFISYEGVFLLPEAGWYPLVPESSPSFDLQVEAPDGIEAVTSGEITYRGTTDGTTISGWKTNHTSQGLSLSAGRYVVWEAKGCGVPLYAYFLPETGHLAEDYLSSTSEYLDLYTKLIGPYPFSKFAVVENFFPTGYGLPSYTLLGSSVIRLPFIVRTSLGHEVAHSWFGNCVLVDERSGNWSEGLTSYIADYMFKEKISQTDAQEYRKQILRDYAALVSPEKDLPLAEFRGRSDPVTHTVGYGKGAMVFHMARRIIGDEAFWKGLQNVFREKRFANASWNDFAEAFDKSGNTNLKVFLHQWVDRAGAPLISLETVHAEKTDSGWRIQGKIAQEEPCYTLRVPVRLKTEGETIESVISMEEKLTSFEICSTTAPISLSLDPDTNIFRRLHPEEIAPIINSIRGAKSPIAIVSLNLPGETLEASRTLLRALGFAEAQFLMENEATSLRIAGQDIIFLGLPANGSLLGPFPANLSVSQYRFIIDGITYDGPGDALFAALPHPGGEARSAAIFLPLSHEAAQVAARKIPHYGKYSLVAFKNGENKVKTVWTSGNSPLDHTFYKDAGKAQDQ